MARPRVRAFSEQLRDAMASSGHTGAELAELAGVDPGVISRFLSGKRDITTATVDRLAAALGLRLVEAGGTKKVTSSAKGKAPPRKARAS